MPVLETSGEITPRSAVRHRPLGGATGAKTHTPARDSSAISQRRYRPRPATAESGESEETPLLGDAAVQPHTDTAAAEAPDASHIRRRASLSPKALPKVPPDKHPKQRRQAHPLLYLGLGMLAMLALWMILTTVLNWATNEINTLKYGYPRTYQTDAFVGHNESAGVPSHFIAMNLHGHIEVIELPGDDAAHAHIYVGPQLFGEGSDLVPMTLQFADVNGDRKPDMIMRFQGTHIVFLNDQGGFRPLKPNEQGPVEQWLRRHTFS